MKGFALSSPQPERCSKSFSLRRIPPQRLFCTFLQKNTSSSLFFPTSHISSSRSYFFQAVTKGRRRSHSLVSPPFEQEIRQLTHVGKKMGKEKSPTAAHSSRCTPAQKSFSGFAGLLPKLAALTRGKRRGLVHVGGGRKENLKSKGLESHGGRSRSRPTRPDP